MKRVTRTDHDTGEGSSCGWRQRAACGGVAAELFFPLDETAPACATQVRAAKAVCARCSVRRHCLDEALDRIPYGIAGGLTSAERRQLRNTRRGGHRATSAGTRGPTRSETRSAGIRALTAGLSVDDVAARFQVCRRTVERWAAAARTQPTSHAVEGSAGATAAPLPSRSSALAGTRITEGPDPR